MSWRIIIRKATARHDNFAHEIEDLQTALIGPNQRFHRRATRTPRDSRNSPNNHAAVMLRRWCRQMPGYPLWLAPSTSPAEAAFCARQRDRRSAGKSYRQIMSANWLSAGPSPAASHADRAGGEACLFAPPSTAGRSAEIVSIVGMASGRIAEARRNVLFIGNQHTRAVNK